MSSSMVSLLKSILSMPESPGLFARTTLVLLFINDLPDHIFKSFTNIFADDTTDYGTTSRSYSHEDLATELNFTSL